MLRPRFAAWNLWWMLAMVPLSRASAAEPSGTLPATIAVQPSVELTADHPMLSVRWRSQTVCSKTELCRFELRELSPEAEWIEVQVDPIPVPIRIRLDPSGFTRAKVEFSSYEAFDSRWLTDRGSLRLPELGGVTVLRPADETRPAKGTGKDAGMPLGMAALSAGMGACLVLLVGLVQMVPYGVHSLDAGVMLPFLGAGTAASVGLVSVITEQARMGGVRLGSWYPIRTRGAGSELAAPVSFGLWASAMRDRFGHVSEIMQPHPDGTNRTGLQLLYALKKHGPSKWVVGSRVASVSMIHGPLPGYLDMMAWTPDLSVTWTVQSSRVIAGLTAAAQYRWTRSRTKVLRRTAEGGGDRDYDMSFTWKNPPGGMVVLNGEEYSEVAEPGVGGTVHAVSLGCGDKSFCQPGRVAGRGWGARLDGLLGLSLSSTWEIDLIPFVQASQALPGSNGSLQSIRSWRGGATLMPRWSVVRGDGDSDSRGALWMAGTWAYHDDPVFAPHTWGVIVGFDSGGR
ncbi:MAG: hypothetical protein HY898_04845 [Deltaproteobacteria bacterium]|nr:hypothetical protein [Deltaproteobacteria bacterium]